MNIFFDIETIPCQEPWIREELAAAVKPPATHKKPEGACDDWRFDGVIF
jgi:hypothetical protein